MPTTFEELDKENRQLRKENRAMRELWAAVQNYKSNDVPTEWQSRAVEYKEQKWNVILDWLDKLNRGDF